MGAVGGVAILGGNFEAPTFPEDKVVQRSLTAGTQENSPIDAIILDALPLGAPGQLDSHAFVWKGHSNDGSPHTIDWKAFINVTADDGTGSLWTLQTRIDGAPYTDILTVDDNGLLTVSGATFTMDQLIIDSDNTEAVLIRKDGDAGDVFIVDTVNDGVRLASNDTFLTLGASNDVRLERAGPRALQINSVPGIADAGDNELRIIAIDDGVSDRWLELFSGTSAEIARVRARRALGGASYHLDLVTDSGSIRFFADGVQRWTIRTTASGDSEFEPFITDRYDLGSASFAVRNLYTNGVLIGQDKTSAYDAITIDGTDLAAPGQQDSGAIILTGLSNDGSAHDSDWKVFVNVTSNGGASTFTIQERIDAASFVTYLSVTSTGNFSAPFPGPHAFGAPPSEDVRNYFTGNFVGQGNGTLANIWVDGILTGGSGDVDGIFGNLFDSNLHTQTETEDIDSMAELVVGTGNMVNNLTGTIENAASILIPGLPTVGVDNAMIYLGGIASNFSQVVGTYDAIRIDQANRGSTGFNDSGKIIWTGVARDGGPPIDADWQLFVQMTANDGTGSIFTIQTRIDAAGYAAAFQLDVDGLTISGVGPHAFGASTETDRRMYFAGAFTSINSSNTAAHLWVDGNLTGDRFDEDGLFGTILDTHIITQTETEDIGIIAQLILADPTITDNLTGTIFQAAVLAIPRPPTEGVDNASIFIGSKGGPLSQFTGTYDAIRIDQNDRFNAGFDDSGKIVFTGVSHDGGSPHDADWQLFVQPIANDGTSIFTFQTRIDAAGYATAFQIEDNGIRVFGGANFNGQFTATTMATALVSTPSGSSATAVGLIPAGSFVVGITVRVTTTVTGPSGFDVGDGIDVDRWGNSIAVASGTTTDITDFTSGAVTNFPVANDVVITSDGVDFTGGAVRITVHYQTLNPATS